MTITFRQLEIFVTAAKDCNFRRTADRFGIAQPSVSKHIRSLESHLGRHLFVRRRGVAPALTFEGLGFLEKAQELVTGRAGMAPGDDSPGGTNTVQLTIMSGPLLLDSCIRPRLSDFCASYPGLALQFTSLHPSRSAEQLINSGDIDVAIYTGEPTPDADLQPESVEPVGCSIYGTPVLAMRARQSGPGLDALPWVMPPDNFAPAQFVRRYLGDAGVRPGNIVARSQFPDVVARMTLEGRGLSVLFDDFAAPLQAEGRIVRIGPRLHNASRLLLVGRRAQHAAFKPVVNLLRQALRTPLGPLPAPAL